MKLVLTQNAIQHNEIHPTHKAIQQNSTNNKSKIPMKLVLAQKVIQHWRQYISKFIQPIKPSNIIQTI